MIAFAYRRVRRWAALRRCSRCAMLGELCEASPAARIVNEGPRAAIRIASRVYLGGLIATSPRGSVVIGSYSWTGEGTFIGSSASITIGSYVGIAAHTHIFDNNNHPTDPIGRRRHRERVAPGGEGYRTPFSAWDYAESAPVVIGDNVWIGAYCYIGKGVAIGEGSIVARQSVVTRSVPPFSIVAGNPARVVKRIDPVEWRTDESSA
jgi:acetyltransferase-like isoleucine patch superfamily enzyme